jgi:pyrroline-5-carboxylate reductase
MGVAILSGVLTSLDTRSRTPHQSIGPSSGISTPTNSQFLDAPDDSLPSRFIATVGREETGRKLKKIFSGMGGLGGEVEVVAGDGNVKAVTDGDVILVWCVYLTSGEVWADMISGKFETPNSEDHIE